MRSMLAMGSLLIALSCAPNSDPPQRNGVHVEVVATGLVIPWSIAVAPTDGSSSLNGPAEIRVIVNDTLVYAPGPPFRDLTEQNDTGRQASWVWRSPGLSV